MRTLQAEYNWFSKVLQARCSAYLNNEPQLDLLSINDDFNEFSIKNCSFYNFISEYRLDLEEGLLLLLAMAPHYSPELLNPLLIKNPIYNSHNPIFGGAKGIRHQGFIPTGETALFLIAGTNLDKRKEFNYLFDDEHFLFKNQVLHLGQSEENEPRLSGALTITPEYLSFLTTGKPYLPEYNTSFPAKHITTEMEWEDLVLGPDVLNEVMKIDAWIRHGETLMNQWEMRKKIKPGFRSLFYGPSGTGKTLCATLLGKSLDMPVFKIDLSMMVSKYIGETEKNLRRVFDKAENRNWILFFDEADALFGKRTSTKSSNDRYANQEVAYLLQRIEDFPGVVILASNLKDNIDEAFARRFQSMIEFPIPKQTERLKLWQTAFSPKCELEGEIDLQMIAEEFEVTGGTIMNVSRYSSIEALQRNSNIIMNKDILTGLRKEYRKEGRVWPSSIVR